MQDVIADSSQYEFECAGDSLYVTALTGDSRIQNFQHPVRNIDDLWLCLLVVVHDTGTCSRFRSVSIPLLSTVEMTNKSSNRMIYP